MSNLSTPRILVSGETLIDFLPERSGPLSEVPTFERRPGGAPANVAVALSRLDETPWFWTRIARDPFGDYLANVLDADLPHRFVERDSSAKTTLAFVTHDEENDRAFTFYRDGTADTRLQRGGVPNETLADIDWVYVGGVMLASDPARTATIDLAERAREAGCSVVFDPNARPELWSGDGGADGAIGFAEAVDELLSIVDVVKATPEDLEMAGFDGTDVKSLAANVCAAGPHTCLLTLGGDGAYAHASEDAPWGVGSATHAGYDVSVVDTTGAGDAFTAGALAALAGDASNDSLDAVLEFANAVAAVTTTESGAMTALPDRADVIKLRESQSQ